ncbi:HTH-type transcriptional regulator MhqR [bacterium HR39]|nr:HTH-type transcriptional regulator MhqR [bacterium HR39]
MRKKLLRRRADPRDRRVRRLHLTPAGRALLEQALPDVLAAQRAIVAPLSPEEEELLLRLLRRLVGLDPVPVAPDGKEEP